LKHKSIGFYKPLSNKHIDSYMKRRRAKFSTTLVSIYETNNVFASGASETSAFIMASDQSPTNLKDCFWIFFLNHDTACLHGPEKYAKLYHLPIYYIDIQRVKRGFYNLYLTLLVNNPSEMEPGKITELYMKTLESKILEHPEFWLWSHRRWKDSRN
jgi:Kdo2-lipid IVA lauroyltransferase/acyltransferase